MNKILPWLLLPLFLFGCAEAPIDITNFDVVLNSPRIKTFLLNNVKYASYETANHKVIAALFEYQAVMVLPLEIVNHTDEDVKADQYSIGLFDGRDLKPIKMLKREDLVAFKSKQQGGGAATAGGIEGQVIQGTLNAILGATNRDAKGYVLKGVDQAIDRYFSFRPIYAREAREGILCFLLDFKEEDPITLKIKLKGEVIKLQFLPRKT